MLVAVTRRLFEDGILFVNKALEELQKNSYSWKLALENKGVKVNLLKMTVMFKKLSRSIINQPACVMLTGLLHISFGLLQLFC